LAVAEVKPTLQELPEEELMKLADFEMKP